METNKILSADLLDLVFEDRNKDYGAYELRRTYDKRIKRSLIITGTLLSLVISGTLLANKKEESQDENWKKTEITLTATTDPEPPPPPPPTTPPPPPEPMRMEKMTAIIIKPDDQVETPPLTQAEATKVQLGTAHVDGADGPDIVLPDDFGDGGIIEAKKPEVETFTPIEIEAEYVGDWRRFLENTLRGDVPVDNGAPSGQYTVIIQFSIDQESLLMLPW